MDYISYSMGLAWDVFWGGIFWAITVTLIMVFFSLIGGLFSLIGDLFSVLVAPIKAIYEFLIKK